MGMTTYLPGVPDGNSLGRTCPLLARRMDIGYDAMPLNVSS